MTPKCSKEELTDRQRERNVTPKLKRALSPDWINGDAKAEMDTEQRAFGGLAEKRERAREKACYTPSMIATRDPDQKSGRKDT